LVFFQGFLPILEGGIVFLFQAIKLLLRVTRLLRGRWRRLGVVPGNGDWRCEQQRRHYDENPLHARSSKVQILIDVVILANVAASARRGLPRGKSTSR